MVHKTNKEKYKSIRQFVYHSNKHTLKRISIINIRAHDMAKTHNIISMKIKLYYHIIKYRCLTTASKNGFIIVAVLPGSHRPLLYMLKTARDFQPLRLFTKQKVTDFKHTDTMSHFWIVDVTFFFSYLPIVSDWPCSHTTARTVQT